MELRFLLPVWMPCKKEQLRAPPSGFPETTVDYQESAFLSLTCIRLQVVGSRDASLKGIYCFTLTQSNILVLTTSWNKTSAKYPQSNYWDTIKCDTEHLHDFPSIFLFGDIDLHQG